MTALVGNRWLWVAIAAAIGAVVPVVATAYWLGVLTLVVVLSVFATSINLLAGYGGMVTLGQAGTLAAAGYAVAYVATRTHAGHAAQIFAAIGVVLVVSAVFGAMAVRTTRVYFLMVTLAQGMVIWGLAYSMSSVTGGENGIPNVTRPPAVEGTHAFYYLCLVVLVAVLLATSVLVRSPFGLGMRAIRTNEVRARALGYNTTLHRFLAFMISGLIAGISGILFVYLENYISPSAAYFQMSADGMVMALVGGLGTITGPVVGALLIVVIKNVVSGYIARWPTVEGVVFVVIVLYARQGIVGLVKDGWTLLRKRFGLSAQYDSADAGTNAGSPLAEPEDDGRLVEPAGASAVTQPTDLGNEAQ